MKKKIAIGLGIILIIAIGGYNYIYKDHRDISEEAPAYTVTASELVNQFQKNASTYQEKYLNKTIEVKGKISSIDQLTLTINTTIFCSMLSDFKSNNYNSGTTVTLKGRLIGYDDLLEEIKLDQCSITN